MNFLVLIIISIFSGIFAGMGMGGGTFLIPALNLILKYDQLICQSTNVVCFIVVGMICFFIYKKNKLIDFNAIIFVSIPACLISILFTIFSIKIKSSILSIFFSIFIIVLGVIYLVKSLTKILKNKKN